VFLCVSGVKKIGDEKYYTKFRQREFKELAEQHFGEGSKNSTLTIF